MRTVLLQQDIENGEAELEEAKQTKIFLTEKADRLEQEDPYKLRMLKSGYADTKYVHKGKEYWLHNSVLFANY